jgi:PrtD family type I secretion system ABC transporter
VIRATVAHKLSGEFIGAQSARELNHIASFLGSNATTALLDLPWMPIFLGLIWFLHPTLGLVALCGAALLIGLGVLNDLITRRKAREASTQQIGNLKFLEGAIRNSEALQAMGMVPAIISRWVDRTGQAQRLNLSASDRTSKITGLMKFGRLFLQVAILGTGALLVLEGEITAGVMIAASIIASRALGPAEQALASWRSLVTARQSYSRVKNLLRSYPAKESSVELPKPSGDVSVEAVTFVPAETQKPTIIKLSMSARPGEICTIIGPSGAGKSTLCRLLVGAWQPYSGIVRLDGASLADWSEDRLGKHIGYLPQDAELFDATVAENIARMSTPDSEAVIAAAKRAGAHEMILRLPQGYDSPLGEAGAKLSGGMRQRLGLARALYGDPCLIVLDEPTTGLDAESEKALFQTLTELKSQNRTIIIVSHHRGLISGSDRLAVLRSGRLVTFGNRDDVLAQITPKKTDDKTSAAVVTEREEPGQRKQQANAEEEDELGDAGEEAENV